MLEYLQSKVQVPFRPNDYIFLHLDGSFFCGLQGGIKTIGEITLGRMFVLITELCPMVKGRQALYLINKPTNKINQRRKLPA